MILFSYVGLISNILKECEYEIQKYGHGLIMKRIGIVLTVLRYCYSQLNVWLKNTEKCIFLCWSHQIPNINIHKVNIHKVNA